MPYRNGGKLARDGMTHATIVTQARAIGELEADVLIWSE